jgi:hypothetical protein
LNVRERKNVVGIGLLVMGQADGTVGMIGSIGMVVE